MPRRRRRASDRDFTVAPESPKELPFPDRRQIYTDAERAPEVAIFFDEWNEAPLAALQAWVRGAFILPLYNTEIQYIARADSQLNYLHDLKDARINGGLVGSGAAFITHTLYRMMFGTPMPEQNASFLPNDQALVKLITDESIDVAVVAAGQPAPIIAEERILGFCK